MSPSHPARRPTAATAGALTTTARLAVVTGLAVLLAACGQEGGAAGSTSTPTAGAAPAGAPTTGSAMTTGPTEPGSTSPSGPASSPGASTPPPGGASPRPSGGSLPLLPRPTAPPTAPTDVPQPVVLVGEVVEPSSEGCVEMTSGGSVFALRLPEGADVAVGDRVRVTGTPRPVERGTPCAGTPVVVTDVAPA